MNVTRQVIDDLLPAYLSGEASADTRTLVDEFLQHHQDVADLVARCRNDHTELDDLLTGADMTLSPDHETSTLSRTKALLQRRAWLFALALAFTLIPVSLTFDGGRITWMMVRDVPRVAMMYWTGALAFWAALWMTNRRLRASGL